MFIYSDHDFRESSGIVPGYFKTLQRGTTTQSVNDRGETRRLARKRSMKKLGKAKATIAA